MPHTKLIPVITAGLFFIVGFVLYLPASSGGWYMDDCHIFLYSPDLANATFQNVINQLGLPRGLSFLSFSLDKLVWGVNPLYSRWVNVALHVVNSLLIAVLFRQITGARRWSLLMGLLFLCHPVQSSAVSYIVQRMTLLSALFALLSVILADRYLVLKRDKPAENLIATLLLAVMCGLLSCMAKENTILLPVIVCAMAWYRGGDKLCAGWKTAVAATAVIPVVTVGLRLLSLGSVTVALDSNFIPVGDTGGPFYDFVRDMSWLPFRYFLSQLEVFWVYIKLVVMPYRQMLDYSWPMPDLVPRPLHVVTFILIFTVVMTVFRFRKRFPLTFLGAVWVIFFMVLESSFLPLDPIFEHRLYLPLFGIILISYEQFFARLHRMGPVIVSIILVGLSYSTLLRNAEWGDPVRFWKSNVEYASKAGRPRFSLAEQLFFAGKYQEATNALEPLTRLLPGNKIGELQLRTAEARFFAGEHEAALEIFRKAAQEDSTLNIHDLYQAQLAIQSGRYGAAAQLLETADAKESKTVFSYYLRGLLAEKQNEYNKGIEYYQKAIDGVTSGRVFSSTKLHFERAFADWSRQNRSVLITRISPWLDRQREVVRADPGNNVLRGNWANQLLVLGLYDEAIAEYEHLKMYIPDSWRLHYNLGIAYSKVGKTGAAEDSYKKSLALSPRNPNAMLNYGLLLYERNNLRKAKSTLESALGYAGGDGSIWIAYGNLLNKLNDRNGALAAYRKARGLPGYGGVAQRLIEVNTN